MNIHRLTLKAQARQAMAAARPGARRMTLFYLLLTSGPSLLVSLFLTNPLTELAQLLQAGLDAPRPILLALSNTGAVSLFVHVFLLLLTVVLDFGYELWCLGTTRGGVGEWPDLSAGFSMAGRVVLLRLAVLLYSFILYMSCLMVAMLISGVVLMSGTVGVLAVLPIFAAAIGFALWRILHYTQASFCLMDHPDDGVFHAMAESRDLMRGHGKEYIFFLLSFLGWSALGLAIQFAIDAALMLVFGGPSLLAGDLSGAMAAVEAHPAIQAAACLLCWPYYAWLTPYQTMSLCRFYDALRHGPQQ